ncbi:MAG TPA: M13-type metalloendopeptidase [Myxococcota bacterium]|nr:M13-type metalloendopeptidase [Myxococcota bacterium]
MDTRLRRSHTHRHYLSSAPHQGGIQQAATRHFYDHTAAKQASHSRHFPDATFGHLSKRPIPGVSAALAQNPASELALHGASLAFAPEPPKKPAIGKWGFDTDGMDLAVKAGDDFNRHANGIALDKTEIPADANSMGAFIRLRDLSTQRTRDIVESLAKAESSEGSGERKVRDLYGSFMDVKTIETAGVKPLAPELELIAGIKSSQDIARVMAQLSRTGATPFGLSIGPDSKKPTEYIAGFSQGGLGLPDRDFYLEKDPRSVELQGKYKQHIANMLKLAGVADADTRAQKIYDLEHKMAEVHWSNVDSRDAEKTYNKWTRADFDKLAPGVDWNAYLGGIGVGKESHFIVGQPSAIAGMAKLVAAESVDTWRDYLTFHLIKGGAPLLPKAFVDEDFAFSGKILAGKPEQGERWKRGVALTSNALADVIAQHYVAKHFTPETKARMEKIVKDVVAAMDARLDEVPWMAKETRKKAKEKLASFKAMIGYPDTWRDYGKLTIEPGQAYANMQRVAEGEHQRNLAKLGQPINRGEWFMTPMTVNAYADPSVNVICFPAAILQPPFFDPNADDAVNYGAIGAVIGHEIGHHFDDQGRKYDAEGRLTDWWLPSDVKNFKAITDKVVAQYGAFEPLPGVKVNGELTLGENIGDLTGLDLAYDAYRASLNGKPAPIIDGTTGGQRFFLGFAQVWRTKYREKALRNLLATDPHSPGMVRAGSVRNSDAWYGAFGVEPGDKMYLPPEQRLRVW